MKTRTLRNAIGVELRKAMTSKALWVAIAAGLLFMALDLVEQYDAISQAIEQTRWMEQNGYGNGALGFSLFSSWSGLAGGTYGSVMFHTLWPVLAAMAFGWSYNNERFSGMYNQIAIRVGRKTYFTAKHTAVFISGGIAYALPVLVDLLVMALFYPAAAPMFLRDSQFACGLMYACPWAYCLLWVGMGFLFGGSAACVCHIAGTYLKHAVMVVLTPYAIFIGIDSLVSMIQASIEIRYVISPFQMVWISDSNPGWLLFGSILLITLGSYGVGYWQLKRNELV